MTDSRYLTRTGVATKAYPGIDRIQFRENPAASNALAQVDEWLRRRFGARSPLAERAVTWGDLVTYGFAKLQEPGGSVLPGTGAGGGSTPDPVPVPTDPSLDPRMPPAPTGLNGAGAAMTIILDWDEPTFSYFGHTEVWRADTDNLAVAVNIGETQSFIYADIVGAGGLTYYYWVRHVSAAGKPGPFNAVAGTEVTTGQVGTGDIAAGTIVADHMTAGSITAANAALADAVVTRAKIDLLAVDDARIENLSVDKLIAGSLAVGQYIQSANYDPGTVGFRINADGTAEFSNLTARGNIAANSITAGASIVSPVIYSSLNGGYAWPAYGVSGGYYLGPSGLLLGNGNGGTSGYFQVTSGGDIYAPQFSIVGGNATFSGSLSAASGTFSGSLTASAVNAVNTINLAGESVTIPRWAGGTAGIGPGTVASASIDAQGQPVIILFTAAAFDSAPGTLIDFYGGNIILRRDGVEIARNQFWGPRDSRQTVSLGFRDAPSAGTHTYVMELQETSGYNPAQLINRSLTLLGCMR